MDDSLYYHVLTIICLQIATFLVRSGDKNSFLQSTQLHLEVLPCDMLLGGIFWSIRSKFYLLYKLFILL